MGEHTALTAATQVQFPWRTVIRTALQGFLGFAAAVTVALLFPEVRTFLEVFLPAGWAAYVYGFGLFVAALAAAISKVMSLPQLQPFLATIGLSAIPASASKAVER